MSNAAYRMAAKKSKEKNCSQQDNVRTNTESVQCFIAVKVNMLIYRLQRVTDRITPTYGPLCI